MRIGVDLVPVGRFVRLLADDEGLADTVFTPREQASCSGRRREGEHLAARFAAKEAVLKALGTGLGAGMHWTDVEIGSNFRGRPTVALSGAVDRRAGRIGVVELDISLTHTSEYAMAEAIALLEQEESR